MSASPLIIAITGAAGHVGSGIAQLALERGHTVVALDIPPEGKIPAQDRYTYKQVNCEDYEAYKEAVKGCNAMIHMATRGVIHDHKIGHKEQQHIIHNGNVVMTYNTLCIAEILGINRVVMASSVNSIGMVFSKHPTFDYLPLDEKHTFRPEDAYSVSKYIAEIQSDAFARKVPSMRIATMRFHYVAPMSQVEKFAVHSHSGSWKDLWGWVSLPAAADACLRALTVDEKMFPNGHETFFIVAGTTAAKTDSLELLRTKYPDITDLRAEFKGNNRSFFDCSKAEKMLGWKEEGFVWRAE